MFKDTMFCRVSALGSHIDDMVKEKIWSNSYVDMWSLVSVDQHTVDKERGWGVRGQWLPTDQVHVGYLMMAIVSFMGGNHTAVRCPRPAPVGAAKPAAQGNSKDPSERNYDGAMAGPIPR